MPIYQNNSSKFNLKACDLSSYRFMTLIMVPSIGFNFLSGLKSIRNQLVTSMTFVSLLHQIPGQNYSSQDSFLVRL